MKVNLSGLTTEQRNEQTKNLDQLSTQEIIQLINNEDQTVAHSVKKILPQIAEAIDVISFSLREGGRLFYIGAGTSGRIGILDAAECPPTFHTPPELVQGIIAGGEEAVYRAIEGAEDDEELGGRDLQSRGLTSKDVVVGIAASGRTPYVIGALNYANKINAKTIAVSCNADSIIGQIAIHRLEVVVGPEVLTGSTRLKAATAQKMILNMLSTGSMVKLGKVYGNLMVDLHPTNKKLIERAKNILVNSTGTSYEKAEEALNETNYQIKPAILKILTGVSYERAMELLEESNGFVRKALDIVNKGKE